MIETVRARLTLWYVSLLAAILIGVIVLIYVLLARALYVRIDDTLQAVIQIAATSLGNDLAEGQDVDDAARSTAAELASRQLLVAIYDGRGRLLGEAGREDDIVIPVPAPGEIPLDGEASFLTIVEADDLDDRHRLALRRVTDEVIDDVVRAARVMGTTRNVSIAAECVHPAPFTGDEDLIRRLVINVLDNAIRYSPAGGAVRVALDRTADTYAVSISDQGPGISPEAQERIFERFYRVDAARTHGAASDGGAGLGLALARWIAQVHDGDIRLATSSRLGSTFVITLPCPS